MKKYCYSLITVLMLALTSQSVVARDKNPQKVADPQIELRIRQIETRVQEIKAMDKSHLTSAERKALREELTTMKKEARAMASGGVYLSVAAIVIILLVLILIL